MVRKQDRWVRQFILIFGLFVVAMFLFLDPIVRSSVKRDMLGARPVTGVATVVVLVPPSAMDMDHPMLPRASVRFNGQIYSAKTIVDFERLRLNRPAQILYRVGKSGRIYVDRVAPLPTTVSGVQP